MLVWHCCCGLIDSRGASLIYFPTLKHGFRCPQQTFDFESMEIGWAQENDKPMEMNLFYGSTQDPVEQDEELMEEENIAGTDY